MSNETETPRTDDQFRGVTKLVPTPRCELLCLVCHEKQTTCSSGLCEECITLEETESETPRAKWRELGPDEVIQEGDGVVSYPSNTYITVGHPYIGRTVSSSSRRFRTRRPLPEVASTNADNTSMTTITDTPRTDAARFEALRSSAFRIDCIPLKLGQELERELSASQEAYLKSVERDDYLTQELSDSRDDLMRTQIEMQLEIDRGEAEAERLKEYIERLQATLIPYLIEDDGDMIPDHARVENMLRRISQQRKTTDK